MEPGFEPEHFKFGGGFNGTVLHPVALAAMLITILAIFLLPRRHLIVAFLLFTFLIPSGQEILLGGAHVFLFRIVVLCGLLRMWRAKSSSGTPILAGGWNSVDTAFSLSIVGHVLAFVLLYQQMGAVANQGGFLWDYVGSYLLLRYAICDEVDINNAIKCFAVLAAIFAVAMVREQLTGQNIFGLLGGVRLMSEVRDGQIRSEAVFQHSILAGTFGATVLPLFVWLWSRKGTRFLATIGILSTMVMAVTCASSTPLLAMGAGILAIGLWPFRKYMRWFRWGLVLTMAGLAIVMNAPIWFLVARVGVLGGSSGYHRAYLLDTFFRHLGDWWLVGTAANGTWGYFMFDMSDEYVQMGITGGLVALIFFIATISRSFARIGNERKAADGNDRIREWRLWFLGSALLANVVAFFGISYFDQMKVSWFTLLAMISAATTLPFGVRAPSSENQADQLSGDAGLTILPASLSGPSADHFLSSRTNHSSVSQSWPGQGRAVEPGAHSELRSSIGMTR